MMNGWRRGNMQSSEVRQRVGFVEIARVSLKIGAMSYGGPAIVGIKETEIQERRNRISKREFIEGLALVNRLPGSLVTQLGTNPSVEASGVSNDFRAP
jgi:chromate transport protein ChrA